MGWARGSEILLKVWTTARPFVPVKKRVALLAELIEIVEDNDCDTVYELLDEWPEVRPAMK